MQRNDSLYIISQVSWMDVHGLMDVSFSFLWYLRFLIFYRAIFVEANELDIPKELVSFEIVETFQTSVNQHPG